VSRLPSVVEVTGRVRIPASELSLSFARSGGPGGQHVNRTATKVQLRWNLRASAALSEGDRAWLEGRLAARLTVEGDLIVASERHRDQRRNVEDALERFRETLRRALARPRPSKRTKPARVARERRLEEKKRRARTKRDRRTPRGD
jgi:ribosome-associated protein